MNSGIPSLLENCCGTCTDKIRLIELVAKQTAMLELSKRALSKHKDDKDCAELLEAINDEKAINSDVIINLYNRLCRS